jgi:hypothetical protein
VKKLIGLYPRLRADISGSAAVGQAGGVLLVETIRTSRIDRAVSEALSPWRRPLAVHDPGKIVLDLAIALALGGDCLAVNLLRAEPGVFGRVASDPTVSRLVDTLAADVDRALAAIEQARASARQNVWALAGEYAPDHDTDASRAVDHRSRRDVGDGALGEGTCGADVQARLRVPSAVGVRRPRSSRDW